ncbi:YvaD family protein [Fontibacillus sp. BL9]|uniref:YvaD family protein n=1 Tax=Fontibacillus sp. BL9 TaxID=3389971 RepID=UPI00397CD328
MRLSLKSLMVMTDVGFIIYWAITFLEWIPKTYAYQDYSNPLLVSWNMSFLPLDLFISGTGLMAIALSAKKNPLWKPLALISMVLTFCSGLQAIAFWSIRLDFDLLWWIPNLFLMLYPLFFIPGLLQREGGIRA